MNYQEEAERHAVQEYEWAWEDAHYIRVGYTGPPLNHRPPGITCGTPACDNCWPFDGSATWATTEADGWRLVAYGSLRSYVEPSGQVVKDHPRHWICPECVEAKVEHLDVLDAPWKEDNDQAIEAFRKAKGCWNCSTCSSFPDLLQEAIPIGEFLCPDCKSIYNLGLKHGQRWTEGQLLEHDPQW